MWNWLSFSPLSSSILKGFGKVVNKNRSFRGSGTQVYQFVWNKNKGSLRAIERDQVWVSHRASSMWGARSVASALMFKEFNQSMVDCQCGAGFRCTAKWTIDTHMCMCECALSRSVVSDSVTPWTVLQPTRLLCPWNFPGENIGVGCHFLLQGNFPTQVSNPCLLCLVHWQTDYLWVVWEAYTHTHTHTHTHTQFNQVEFFPGWL